MERTHGSRVRSLDELCEIQCAKPVREHPDLDSTAVAADGDHRVKRPVESDPPVRSGCA